MDFHTEFEKHYTDIKMYSEILRFDQTTNSYVLLRPCTYGENLVQGRLDRVAEVNTLYRIYQAGRKDAIALDEALKTVYNTMLSNQQPFPPEFAKILNANLWDLYES